jgi:hypothetical protein
MSSRQRIILRLDVEANTDDGRLLNYLKSEAAVSLREAVLRALRAFYLPWAMESESHPEALQPLAKTVLEELQLRSFQIQARFLACSDHPTWVMVADPSQITISPVLPTASAPMAPVQAEPQPQGIAESTEDFVAAGLDVYS